MTIVAGQIRETTGAYTQLFGSLQVVITPQAVINGDAQWRVDDGHWQDSGTTISGLTAGDHTVVCKGVFGWTRPPDQTVMVYGSQVTNATGDYTQITTGVTLRVPSEYTTIQSAINAASDADTVLVADGTYVGLWNKNLDFNGKAIKVVSENGTKNCIIDCERSGRGFYFHNGERQHSVLSGFTIRNGSAMSWAGGIYCRGISSPTIVNCIVSGNSCSDMSYSSSHGGGILIEKGSPIILDCIVSGNVCSSGYSTGGGIANLSGSPVITNCIVFRNQCLGVPHFGDWCAIGGGIYTGGSSVITNCIVFSNQCIGPHSVQASTM